MELYRRWVATNAWAEGLGLGLAGTSLALAITQDATTAVVLAAAVAAGAAEGLVVGWAQARVVHRALPHVDRRAWITWTVVGGVLAWVAGSLPAQLLALDAAAGAVQQVSDPALWAQLALAVPLGVVTGPILGGLQALALRGVVPRPGRWVTANAVAWAAGMPVVFLAAGSVGDGTPAVWIVGLAATSAVAAGAVVGAVHGRWLVAFAADAERRERAVRPADAVSRSTP